MNDYGQHVIHMLRKEGYVSALAGIQHIASHTDEKQAWQIIGYDRHLEGDTCEQAVSFLEHPPQEPFFLSVGFFETHRPFPELSTAPDDPDYCRPPAPLPDTPDTREDMARFKASARILDKKIGAVLAALDRSGLANETLVICTTDHGIAFPGMKCNLTDSGIGTMLIMRGPSFAKAAEGEPDVFTGGKVVNAMTTHLDIFPTICDVLAVDSPAWLRGHSLLPLVKGEVDDIHETLFFEVNYHAAYEPMRAVRTKRWKYIKRFDGRTSHVLPNCDDGESKSFLLKNDWNHQMIADEALFDLLFDPNEAENLIEDPACQSIRQDLENRLEKWMRETNDPLLQGKVPAPSGAVINDPNGLSPQDKLMSG